MGEPGQARGRNEPDARIARSHAQAFGQGEAPREMQQRRPRRLRLRRVVGGGQHHRWPAAPVGGVERALPQVVERGGHDGAPGEADAGGQRVGHRPAFRICLREGLLDELVGDEIADEGDRVGHASRAGQARHDLTGVRENQAIGQGLRQVVPARRARQLAAPQACGENDLTIFQPLDQRVGNLHHVSSSRAGTVFISRSRPGEERNYPLNVRLTVSGGGRK